MYTAYTLSLLWVLCNTLTKQSVRDERTLWDGTREGHCIKESRALEILQRTWLARRIMHAPTTMLWRKRPIDRANQREREREREIRQGAGLLVKAQTFPRRECSSRCGVLYLKKNVPYLSFLVLLQEECTFFLPIPLLSFFLIWVRIEISC